MRIKTTVNTVPIILIVMAMIISIGGGMMGCGKTGEDKPSVIDVEKIIDFTGSIRITLPDGTVKDLKIGDKLFPMEEKTLIEVLSKECTGVLGGNIVMIKEGQIARIIRPGVIAQKVIKFTGELKIILPNGTVIFIQAGEPLPTLSDGTIIEVISGDLIVLVNNEEVLITPGEVVWIEPAIEEDTPESEGSDISPASPYSP